MHAQWNDEAAGFVGYGSAGGARAVENLRLIMGELQVVDVRSQVALSLMTDFENDSRFTPADHHVGVLHGMSDQVVAWTEALAPVRVSDKVAA